jgi:hypothetical protein
MKKLIYTGMFFLALCLFSCDAGNEPGIEGTATQKMSGEWFLQLADDANEVIVSYNLFTTSNTAANVATEMWFIDHDVFGAQSKLTVDPATLTFTATNTPNLDYADPVVPAGKPVVALGATKKVLSASPQTMTIADGKVLKDSFIAPSKTRTDSMYLQITGNYVANTYQASEYKITTVAGKADTVVVWKMTGTAVEPDGPYILRGYRRTGFREDEH